MFRKHEHQCCSTYEEKTACVLSWGREHCDKNYLYWMYILMPVWLFFSDSSFHKFSKHLCNKWVFTGLKQSLCKRCNSDTEGNIVRFNISNISKQRQDFQWTKNIVCKGKIICWVVELLQSHISSQERIAKFPCTCWVENLLSNWNLKHFLLWILSKPKVPLGIALNVSVRRHSWNKIICWQLR